MVVSFDVLPFPSKITLIASFLIEKEKKSMALKRLLHNTLNRSCNKKFSQREKNETQDTLFSTSIRRKDGLRNGSIITFNIVINRLLSLSVTYLECIEKIVDDKIWKKCM